MSMIPSRLLLLTPYNPLAVLSSKLNANFPVMFFLDISQQPKLIHNNKASTYDCHRNYHNNRLLACGAVGSILYTVNIGEN